MWQTIFRSRSFFEVEKTFEYQNHYVKIIQIKKHQDCNFIKKESPTNVFSRKFCEIFKNTGFTEHLQVTSFEQWPFSIHDIGALTIICK